MKPKEFLFKKKGSCIKGIIKDGGGKRYRRDIKSRKKGIIYLTNTQLRITFKNGGELVIPLNTIKNLNLFKAKNWIEIYTDTDESYSFHSPDYTSRLYRLLSEVIANLSDGGDVHVGPKPEVNWSKIIIGGFLVGILVLISIVIYALTGFKLFGWNI